MTERNWRAVPMDDNQPMPIIQPEELRAKLLKGEISLCACVGAADGAPCCPCEMERATEG